MANYFYNTLTQERGDSADLKASIEETIDKLLSYKTTSDRPGVMLGKIQSGKTRAFVGVIAKAFDEDFDVAIVLTKNSVLLGQQTTNRLQREFSTFCKEGEIDVYYVNTFNETVLRKAQMLNKKVFVAIKNYKNVEKLIACFTEHNPELANKKILIIDDEADSGSIGYRYDKKTETVEMQTTAQRLDEFRKELTKGYFLQVTATPYSLYLQPEEIVIDDELYQPIKPAFTVLLKEHGGYIGGKFYFEDSKDNENPASNLHIGATKADIDTLCSKKKDMRIFNNVGNTDKLPIFRKAILNFMVGVAARRAQDSKAKNQPDLKVNRLPRFAFIFHIDTQKNNMTWQSDLIKQYLHFLGRMHEVSPLDFRELIKTVYEDDIKLSLEKGAALNWTNYIPTVAEVQKQVAAIMEYEDYNTYLINSDEKIINLANEEGQLKLETGLNFFVGGQVLDRGITIDNLIGFFYGRSPITSQMDTVLQHARMYGNRSKEDLCVTRFYTTEVIRDRMNKIHDIDEALRAALQKGDDHSIICIGRTQEGNIIPTSPNRLSLSDVVTLKTYKSIYPYGFKPKAATDLLRITTSVDQHLRSLSGFTNEAKKSFKFDLATFDLLIDNIHTSFSNFDEGVAMEPAQWKAIVHRLAKDFGINKVHCYVQEGRLISRYHRNGEPSDSPYTSSTDLKFAKQVIASDNSPLLMLLRQEGKTENNWTGAPFYWPILVLPELQRPLLFEWSSENQNKIKSVKKTRSKKLAPVA
jgi:hypothetical protein